jgi:Mycothiol maleylpyruvate isomerase N-terminal domain
MADEDAGWTELQALIGRLSLEQLERPGYFEEGWSAKDVLSHVGSWLAAAAAVLDRIRMGTYRREDIDIDALNARFLKLMKDVPLDAVRAQALSARARMLQAWNQLPNLTDEAGWWIRKAGAEHYAEHLPRVREWVRELQVRD